MNMDIQQIIDIVREAGALMDRTGGKAGTKLRKNHDRAKHISQIVGYTI